MPSLEVTNFLESMKRKGDVLSIKDLNAQINAMMKVICLVEDEDSRIQFMKRIEVVQKDLHCLRSKIESKMPSNSKRPSILNIDHSRFLIGSPEEGWIPLTKKIWLKVQDITQKIDRISEGLVFVVQRHRDSSDSDGQPQTSSPNKDRYPHFDYPSHSDLYIRDKTQQSTHRPRDSDYEKLDNGSNYSFEYPRSNDSQVQPSFGHATPYYHPSTISQTYQNNQFTPTPNYLNPQPPDMNHYGRYLTKSSSSSLQQVEASRNEYAGTGYPSGNLNYFPGGPQFKHGGNPYEALNMPYPPGSPIWGIPANMANLAEVNSDSSSIKYRSEGSSLRSYPQNSQRTSAKHTVAHRSRN